MYTCACVHAQIHARKHICRLTHIQARLPSLCTHMYTRTSFSHWHVCADWEHPISLLRISLLRLLDSSFSGQFPMDMRVPPLTIKILLEPKPPKSRISARRLALSLWSEPRTSSRSCCSSIRRYGQRLPRLPSAPEHDADIPWRAVLAQGVWRSVKLNELLFACRVTGVLFWIWIPWHMFGPLLWARGECRELSGLWPDGHEAWWCVRCCCLGIMEALLANLPTKIIPTKIRWLRLSGKFPMDMRIPLLNIQNLSTEIGRIGRIGPSILELMPLTLALS